MKDNLPKVRHVQTLVEMNHCVGTARRDAAFDNLEKYCEEKLGSARVKQRKQAYAYCLYLVNEALTAAEHSALIEEKQGMLDRPATHFLKLLQDMSREKGMTVVVVTHNLAITPMADQIIRMKSGKVVSDVINENPQDISTIEW